jgi:hypothetical protein
MLALLQQDMHERASLEASRDALAAVAEPNDHHPS